MFGSGYLKTFTNNLEQHTLDLLDFLNVDVSHQKNPDQGQGHDDSARDQHASLANRVGLDDGISNGVAHGIRELNLKIVVDGLPVLSDRLGQKSLQRAGQSVSPDGARDTVADSSAHVAKEAKDGKNGSDVVVASRGHDGNLLTNDHGATGKGDENLAHDDITDLGSRSTEVDEKTDEKDVQGHRDQEKPLVATGVANQETDEEQPNTRDNVEDGVDVTSFGNAGIEDNLEVRSEVAVPAVVGDLVSSVKKTGSHDVSVEQQLVWDERNGGKELLPDSESNETGKTNHEHGDDVSGAPVLSSSLGDGEGEEEEDQTGGEKNDSNDCELLVELSGWMFQTYYQTQQRSA